MHVLASTDPVRTCATPFCHGYMIDGCEARVCCALRENAASLNYFVDVGTRMFGSSILIQTILTWRGDALRQMHAGAITGDVFVHASHQTTLIRTTKWLDALAHFAVNIKTVRVDERCEEMAQFAFDMTNDFDFFDNPLVWDRFDPDNQSDNIPPMHRVTFVDELDHIPIKETETTTHCGICGDHDSEDVGDEFTELFCGHKFHDSCGARWFKIHASCPTCRAVFKTQDPAFNKRNCATITWDYPDGKRVKLN